MSQIQVYFPRACHAVNCKLSYFRAIISRHTSALRTENIERISISHCWLWDHSQYKRSYLQSDQPFNNLNEIDKSLDRTHSWPRLPGFMIGLPFITGRGSAILSMSLHCLHVSKLFYDIVNYPIEPRLISRTCEKDKRFFNYVINEK